MTSLIAWAGIDNRSQSSLYFASDSRISYDGWGKEHWDFGRKLFASTKYPEIFGYFGTAAFPPLILSQIIDLLDRDILFSGDENPDTKRKIVYGIIRKSFEQYLKKEPGEFTIIYATRQHEKMQSVFHLAPMEYTKQGIWIEHEWVDMPENSEIIFFGGSGEEEIKKSYEQSKQISGKTSRSAFGAFCESLEIGNDPLTGGAPQLVGLRRIESAKSFGIIHKNKRYMFGIRLNKPPYIDRVEWYNSRFEECDGVTKKPLSKEQKKQRKKKKKSKKHEL